MIAPDALAWIVVLLAALLFGSFLNVCISRLPHHRSIVRPGSHCPRCGAGVRPRDNVPVVSWVLLRGRCRDCANRISIRYPLVEAGYAGLVAAAVWRFGFTVEAVAGSVFCFFALGLLVTDLETMLLPDALTWTGIGVGLACSAALSIVNLPHSGLQDVLRSRQYEGVQTALAGAGERVLSAAAWTLAMLAIRWGYYALRRRHGLGAGDVKLVAMLAVWLGSLSMAVAFFVAVVAAALVGIVVGVVGSQQDAQRSRAKSEELKHPGWRMVRLPLGAFLCGGGIYAFFFGQSALRWYLSFWL